MKVALAIMAFVLWVAGWQLATIHAAAHLDSASLGAPFWTLGGRTLHAPWKWWFWMKAFGQPPAFFRTTSAIAYGSLLLAAFGPGLLARRSRKSKTSTAHGSAKMSKLSDLRVAGFGEDGVVLCQSAEARYTSVPEDGKVRHRLRRTGPLVCDNSDGHVLCFAPTRSGKGISLIVPTLLTWRHSVVVTDPKKENYNATAGWRRQFSHVICFEPTRADSAAYNPLLAVPRGRGDVRAAQNIAEVLIPKDEKGRRDHWQLCAYKILFAAILHVLYAGEKKDLRGVLELLCDPDRSIREVLGLMMRTPHLGDRPHRQVVLAARAALNKSDKELSGVISTLETALDLWLDPIVAETTSRSDFCATQLQYLQHPVSLYIVVPAGDIERLRPLVRLMLIQIGNELTGCMEPDPAANSRRGFAKWWGFLRNLGARLDAALSGRTSGAGRKRQRLLFLLDEFGLLGYVPWIEIAMSYIAGWNIKLLIVVQSLNQIEKWYGQNHAFLDNAQTRVTYTAYDERTAKRVSDLLGQGTVVQDRESRSKRAGSLFSESVTQSQQEHGRPLMTAGEVQTLAYDEALLFPGGVAAYRGKKIMYYLDPRFAVRANWPRPDTAAEQAAELPRPLPASHWSTPPIASAAEHTADGLLEVADDLALLADDEFADVHAAGVPYDSSDTQADDGVPL